MQSSPPQKKGLSVRCGCHGECRSCWTRQLCIAALVLNFIGRKSRRGWKRNPCDILLASRLVVVARRVGKVAFLSLHCPRVTILTSSHHPCRIFTETCTAAVAWSQLPRAIISSTVRIVSFLLLIIHSIPSQPWRNSMPHLAPGARCRSVTFPCQKSQLCRSCVCHT